MKKELKKIKEYTNSTQEEMSPLNEKIDKKTIKVIFVHISIMIIYTFISLIFKKSMSSISNINVDFYFFVILFSLLLLSSTYFIYRYVICKKELTYKLLVIKKYLYKTLDIIQSFILGMVIMMSLSFFVFTLVKVSGSSMEGTYQDNDTIIVWHLFYTPKVDDVVVIDANFINEQDIDFLIKRVVAVSGDKLEYINGNLVINDVIIESMDRSTYDILRTNRSTNEKFDIVPKDFVIVLGDNRNNSTDSRSFGLIENDLVIGKSIFRVAPFSSFGVPIKEVK